MNSYKIKNVDEMTIDELIGQVIMVGLPDLYLDDKYKEFIRDYKIGNYILFSRNYKDTKQLKTFMSELYKYTESITGSFPLVSIDQEGGMVVRLFKDVTFPASPMTTSATSVINAPYITGTIIGKDMLKLGVNLNLAPCLEINCDLSNPLVNVRGYGATKEIVLENARKFINGLQDSGVLSCVKHFPGAGSSPKDTHLELSLVEENKENLLNYNMYPFINLLESDALMSSHSIYKSFDKYPSTLSKVLLTDVLRNELKFNGLIISDGMEMKAIADHYGIGNGCVMALNAGCDILLLCHKYEEQMEAFESVKEAVKNGILSIEKLKEKVKRINKAKEKLVSKLKASFTKEDYLVNIDDHSAMQDIVDNSYTNILGKNPSLDDNTLIISPKVKVASIVEDEFDERNLTKALSENFPNNKILEFESNIDFINNTIKLSELYNKIIIYSYDAYKDNIQIELINELLLTNKEIYVISIKGPIDQKCFNNLKNYACLYEYTPNSIRTIIKQLKNDIILNGKLPK